jgi:type VI protein secretion system component VasK
MVDKNKNVLAGLTMAQSLDDQTQSDLAELMRKVKKSGRIKTSPIEIDIRSESIQNPGKFGLRRNTITKKQYGGKVQKMEGGGSALNPDELLKVIEQLKEQGRVAGKGQELSSSQNKKIADSFEANFNKLFGKKYGGLIKKMKLGGLIGGQKKLDKNKDGKISGDDFAMMEMGGKVEEYGHGGSVKGGKMSCRGMGAAIKGGGFKIR